MTRVVTISMPSQLSRSDPVVWGDGWKSQEASTHLAFSCNWKEKSQIFFTLFWSPRPFLLPVYSWVWCSVLSTVEMSHCLLFRAHLYISYIHDHIWNGYILFRQSRGYQPHLLMTQNSKAAGTGCVTAQSEGPQLQLLSNSCSKQTANNHSALPHRENIQYKMTANMQSYSTQCQFTIPRH